MKYSIHFPVCLLLGLVFFFSACEKDDGAKSDKSTNQWIESTMRSWYLWYDQIPEKAKLNYNADPEVFFQSLLYVSKDGKTKNDSHYFYSTIQKKSTTTRASFGEEPSLGFEYQSWNFTNEKVKALNVLYILPDSPAEEAGLKRGDWIVTINGSAVSDNNLSALRGASSVRLGISDNPENAAKRNIDLSPRVVDDNPVFLDTVYTVQNVKIGYMVYNHFSSGPDNDGKDERYNNTLRKSFAEFKDAGVKEFILDLRYNGGGLVTSAQLLSTMLSPAYALGQEFCHLEYNSNHSSNRSILKLDEGYMKKGERGENLDLPRLFVLTSLRTASASEAVINGLKPYYDVVVIGGQTEGKNVGSVTLESSEHNYELHPIVCQIYNKDNKTDYSNGFSPVWPLDENSQKRLLLIMEPVELGDVNKDPLLNVALQWMFTGGVKQNNLTRSSVKIDATPGYCSLDRKTNNGVQVPL